MVKVKEQNVAAGATHHISALRNMTHLAHGCRAHSFLIHPDGYWIIVVTRDHRVDHVEVGEVLTQDGITRVQQQVTNHLQQPSPSICTLIRVENLFSPMPMQFKGPVPNNLVWKLDVLNAKTPAKGSL